MVELKIFSASGIEQRNEDYVLKMEISSNVALIVVCDGMGGLSYGAETARLVAHSIAECLGANYTCQSPDQSILNAIDYANETIAKESQRLHAKMGASVALTLLVDNRCYYTWLGDVRIYHRRDDNLALLTKDHLAIEDNHLFLSRCVNGREFRNPAVVSELSMHSGDEIFIASDGYYLHNDIGTPIASAMMVEDDATIVCVRLT